MEVTRYLFICLTIGTIFEITECAKAASSCSKFVGFNGKLKYRRRGNRAVFKCDRGDDLYGERRLNCQRDGTWDGEMPMCLKSGCVPVDISQSPYLAMTEEYGGKLLKFFCETGFQLLGATESYCDGRSWSSPLPKCAETAEFTECDFEQDLCGWTQDDTDEGEWIRHAGATNTGNTGPKFDHTHMDQATGHYMFFEASNPTTNGDKARLVSPEYLSEMSPMCFDFWYHMLGPDEIGHVGSLDVYVRGMSQFLDDIQPVFHKEGNQGDMWNRGEIVIDEMTEPYQIVIVATRKVSYISDIAIDDLRLYNCTDDATTTTTTSTTEATTTTSTTTETTTETTTTTTTPTTSKQTSTTPSTASTTSTISTDTPATSSTISPAITKTVIVTKADITTRDENTTTANTSPPLTKTTAVTNYASNTTTDKVSPSTDVHIMTKKSTPSQTSTPKTTAPTTSTTSPVTSTTTPVTSTTACDTSTTPPASTPSTSTIVMTTTSKPVVPSETTKTTTLVTTGSETTTTATTTTPATTPQKSSTPLQTTTPSPRNTASTVKPTPPPATVTPKSTRRKITRTTTIPSTATTATTTTTSTTTTIPQTSTSVTSKAIKGKPIFTKPITTRKRTVQTARTSSRTSLKTTGMSRTMSQTTAGKPTTTISTEQPIHQYSTLNTTVSKPTETTPPNSTQQKTNPPDVSVAEVKASEHPGDSTLMPLMIGLGVGIVAGLIIIGVIAYVCVRRRKFYTSRYEDELRPITNAASTQSINNVQYYHDEEYEN